MKVNKNILDVVSKIINVDEINYIDNDLRTFLLSDEKNHEIILNLEKSKFNIEVFIQEYGVYYLENQVHTNDSIYTINQFKEFIELRYKISRKDINIIWQIINKKIPSGTNNIGLTFNNINFNSLLEKSNKTYFFRLNWDYKETNWNNLHNDLKNFLRTGIFNKLNDNQIEEELILLARLFILNKDIIRPRFMGYVTNASQVGKSKLIELILNTLPRHYYLKMSSSDNFDKFNGFEKYQLDKKLICYWDDFRNTIYLNDFVSIITEDKLTSSIKGKNGSLLVNNTANHFFTSNDEITPNKAKNEYFTRYYHSELTPIVKKHNLEESSNIAKLLKDKNIGHQFVNYLITLARDKKNLELLLNKFNQFEESYKNKTCSFDNVSTWIDDTPNIDEILHSTDNFKENIITYNFNTNPYISYVEYCINLKSKPLSNKNFVTELRNKGYILESKQFNTKGKRYIVKHYIKK